mgnify:CR=1 FL=1
MTLLQSLANKYSVKFPPPSELARLFPLVSSTDLKLEDETVICDLVGALDVQIAVCALPAHLRIAGNLLPLKIDITIPPLLLEVSVDSVLSLGQILKKATVTDTATQPSKPKVPSDTADENSQVLSSEEFPDYG